MERESKQNEGRLPEDVVRRLCAEAQADGVPCTELGRDCPTCERAVLAVREARRDVPRRG